MKKRIHSPLTTTNKRQKTENNVVDTKLNNKENDLNVHVKNHIAHSTTKPLCELDKQEIQELTKLPKPDKQEKHEPIKQDIHAPIKLDKHEPTKQDKHEPTKPDKHELTKLDRKVIVLQDTPPPQQRKKVVIFETTPKEKKRSATALSSCSSSSASVSVSSTTISSNLDAPISSTKTDHCIALVVAEEEQSRLQREHDDYSIARRIAQSTTTPTRISTATVRRYPARSPGAWRFPIYISDLHSMVSSDQFMNNYESLVALENVNVGVDPSVLETIGSFKFNGEKLAENSCPICIEEFRTGDELRKLPCHHVYHLPCIDTWLQKSKKCPLCKNHLQ